MKNVYKSVVALTLAVSLSACASSQNSYQTTGYNSNQKQAAGTVAGALAGAAVGNQFGKGSGKKWATGIGAILGASLGSGIGASADRADQMWLDSDNQYVEDTGLRAMQTGQVQRWENPQTGSWGVVTPYNARNVGNSICRDFEMKSVRNSLPHEAEGTACKDVNGTWTIL